MSFIRQLSGVRKAAFLFILQQNHKLFLKFNKHLYTNLDC